MNGAAGVVVTVGGRPFAVMGFTVSRGQDRRDRRDRRSRARPQDRRGRARRRVTGPAQRRGVEPGALEVEELGHADAERVHLLHLGLQLGGRLLALALAGLLLGGEVDRHGVGAAVVGDGDAAEDVGAEGGPVGGVLGHELAGPVGVAAAALHDLDEAGGVGVADDVEDDVGAVLEGGLAGEQLGRLGPPAVLLGTVAVAAGGLLGLEAGQRDEAAVLGHPGGRAEPAGRTGSQVPRHRSNAARACSASETCPWIT